MCCVFSPLPGASVEDREREHRFGQSPRPVRRRSGRAQTVDCGQRQSAVRLRQTDGAGHTTQQHGVCRGREKRQHVRINKFFFFFLNLRIRVRPS